MKEINENLKEEKDDCEDIFPPKIIGEKRRSVIKTVRKVVRKYSLSELVSFQQKFNFPLDCTLDQSLSLQKEKGVELETPILYKILIGLLERDAAYVVEGIFR